MLFCGLVFLEFVRPGQRVRVFGFKDQTLNGMVGKLVKWERTSRGRLMGEVCLANGVTRKLSKKNIQPNREVRISLTSTRTPLPTRTKHVPNIQRVLDARIALTYLTPLLTYSLA